MKKLAELFGSSSRELKSVRTITVCAMLAAAAIILVNFRIELTNTQRIGFSGIPNQLVAYLFGPAVSCLFAGALDIIKYLIKPVGAFFPGLTLVTMLAGLIYGFFFYKKPLKLTRVLAAHFLVCLVCNVILNTLCLSILYGQAFMILLPPRVIQNIVKWPIDSFIFFNVAKMLEMSGVFRVLAAHFLVCLVCNVILNTLCLSILYGQAFMILLPPRVIQNIVKWPIDSFIFFNVAKMLEMSGVFRVVRGSRAAVQR